MAERYDTAYWRKRAVETRNWAESMSDAATRRIMLRLAATYELMAQHEKGPGAKGTKEREMHG